MFQILNGRPVVCMPAETPLTFLQTIPRTTPAATQRFERSVAARQRVGANVPSVTRAMALLEMLAAARAPMSLARLSESLELPKSSVHALCHTLLELGYLRRQGDAGFFIGPAVMPLAASFASGTDVVQAFGLVCDDLAGPTDETIILSVLDGREVVYLAARGDSRPLGLAFRAGTRLPANLAASGRAMLANLSVDAVRERFSSDGPAPNSKGEAPTIDQLLEDLAITHQRGYSIDDESVRIGVYCIGAAVFDAHAAVVAGVGMCMQKAALDSLTRAKQRDMVLNVARLLSERLGGKPISAASATQ